MKREQILGGAIVFAIALAIGGGRVWGEAQSALPHGGATSSLSMARFYTAPLGNLGQFPGKLVRLSCNSDETRSPTERCALGYALSMDDGGMIHPLLAGTEEMRRQLGSDGFEGCAVTVHGKYYPSVGTILVSRVDTDREEAPCETQ